MNDKLSEINNNIRDTEKQITSLTSLLAIDFGNLT